MALTGKQEKFVRGLVAGMSQREAYRAAYDCQRSSDKTVDNKASALWHQGGIRARYQDLRDALADKVTWDRAEATRRLQSLLDTLETRVVKTGANELDTKAVREARQTIAELNKVHRIYEIFDAGDESVTVIWDV